MIKLPLLGAKKPIQTAMQRVLGEDADSLIKEAAEYTKLYHQNVGKGMNPAHAQYTMDSTPLENLIARINQNVDMDAPVLTHAGGSKIHMRGGPPNEKGKIIDQTFDLMSQQGGSGAAGGVGIEGITKGYLSRYSSRYRDAGPAIKAEEKALRQQRLQELRAKRERGELPTRRQKDDAFSETVGIGAEFSPAAAVQLNMGGKRGGRIVESMQSRGATDATYTTAQSPMTRRQKGEIEHQRRQTAKYDHLKKPDGEFPGGQTRDQVQRDAIYMNAVRQGKINYNGHQSKMDDLNAQIDRAFDKAFDAPAPATPKKQKSNGSINPVPSKEAGAGDVVPGDMGYAGFSSAFERHSAGAMLGIGATYASEGEVSMSGTVRGALFGAAGGKAARMFTGSMRGGAVNSMARGVGDTLATAEQGTIRRTAGDYLTKAMSGFDAAKSQDAMRIATFAGAGLAGFSMGRDRNHSRGMNGSRGNRF